MDWFTVIVSLVASIVVAIITAIVTTALAYKRFRNERWWELKFEAYESIFGYLLKIENTLKKYRMKMKGLIPGINISLQESLEQVLELNSIVHKCEFRLSPETRDLMQHFLEAYNVLNEINVEIIAGSPDKETEEMTFAFEAMTCIRDYIQRIREAAKKDLKVR